MSMVCSFFPAFNLRPLLWSAVVSTIPVDISTRVNSQIIPVQMNENSTHQWRVCATRAPSLRTGRLTETSDALTLHILAREGVWSNLLSFWLQASWSVPRGVEANSKV
jgi:hypothetical protein